MNSTAHPLLHNPVKEKLGRGEVVTSLTVRLVDSVAIASLAATAGFDSLYVDLEHSNLSPEAASQICITALHVGIAPFIRVRSLDHGDIAGALDGGALGVIAPQVRSAAQARSLVAAAKYPPAGLRSISSTLPQLGFAPGRGEDVLTLINEATMVIAMLETAEALEELDDLARTPGLDLLLIGANDLTAELGVPGEYDHPRAMDAYKRTIDVALAAGKSVGIGGVSLDTHGELLDELVSIGVRYVSSSTDIGFLLRAAKDWQYRFTGRQA